MVGLFLGEGLYRDFAVGHLLAAFQQMQFCHFQGLVAEIDAGDMRAAPSHAFGQDAAATANVEHGLSLPARQGGRCNPSRSGLISCSGLNSLLGSHQRWASWLNLSSSSRSTFTLPFSICLLIYSSAHWPSRVVAICSRQNSALTQ